MSVDLAAEVVAALRSEAGRAALKDAIAPVVADEVRRALAEKSDVLEPLSNILGVSKKAASARLTREPELRKLGVRVGRRTLFTRARVLSYFGEQQAERTGLRVVGGE